MIFTILIVTSNAQEKPGKVKENVLRAVVKIEAYDNKTGKKSTGTGFLVSRPSKAFPKLSQFFLVTNKHMVGDWNLADGNILSYKTKIDIYLYTNGQTGGNFFLKKTVSLFDSSQNVSNKIRLHSNPKVDVAMIDISYEIRSTPDLNLWSFDTSYLLKFDKIYEAQNFGIGDQVFAIGYPLKITSTHSNLPISKTGCIASLPGTEFKVEIGCENRMKKKISTTAEGKLILVDGLIVGGNSGGPVVIAAGIQFKFDEKSGNLLRKEHPENLVLGIVSMGIGESGINIIYSSDYIQELIDEY